MINSVIAPRLMEDHMRDLKIQILVSGVKIRLVSNEDELQPCRDVARDLANALVRVYKGKTISLSPFLSKNGMR